MLCCARYSLTITQHGYVERWTDWPFSSSHAFLEAMRREKAEAIWRKFPVLDYGQGWDNPEYQLVVIVRNTAADLRRVARAAPASSYTVTLPTNRETVV
jgi:hypothetical protein